MADPQIEKRLERMENMLLCLLNREHEKTGKLFITTEFDTEPQPIPDVWCPQKSEETERIVKAISKRIDRKTMTMEQNKTHTATIGRIIDHNW